ncbi:cleft lip and palate transmembrane 1 [Aureobasidium namibiae CBS 147.97]|uniref:Cleft lip and palate transmembrane 1 n=1 Tax=Aureobasidium namibiae CBS 147.97 TaxID=1043004 RepID=A0A074XQ23_9PEZI
MSAAQQQPAQGTNWLSTTKQVAQTVGIFMFVNFAIKQVTGGIQQQKQADNAPVPTVAPGTGQQPSVSPHSAVPNMIMPLWQLNTSMDINMYVSPSFAMPALSQMPADSLVLQERNYHYGDWSDKRHVQTTIAIPQAVQENGTLWAHIYISQSGSVMDPTQPGYDSFKAYRVTRPLTNYLAKKKVHKTRNLLDSSDAEDQAVDVVSGPTISNYYHPNFTLSIIPNIGTPVYPQMHPAMRQFVSLETTGARDDSGQNAWYYPVLYLNTFWQLRSQMTELNSTITEMPLNLDLQTDPNWKFSILASMDEGMKENARKSARGETTAGGGDGSELEMIKEVLLDTNMYLLGITGFVSILHMIFEMLAFKNDVSHWRKKKDNIGTSVRTILANVFMQSVIFLYLMDNNENTSWMILFGQGMGIAIEAWKVTKAVDVRVRAAPEGSLIPYRVVFEDKHKLSDVEKKTQEYDEIAFRYLYMVAVPLLLAYAGYSLVYETHKSWYSFIIATLVGSVYAYGFLMMVPSLYINYRLKSVAHMPAKAMTYKFLNTFIDDLFAFTIKMPTLHRLATLRDDVIFFVYLYQAWAYKVDHTRVNEFGQGGDDEEVEEKKAAQPLKSAPKEDTTSVKAETSSSDAQSKAGVSRKRK